MWRLSMFSPSTSRRSFAGSTRSTRPPMPPSLPASTLTSSPERILRRWRCLPALARVITAAQLPALGARQRPALDHPHDVALARVVVLVGRVQRARAAEDLRVAAVPARDVDPHDDRLLGPVGDHDTLAYLAPSPALAVDRREL